MASNKGAGLMTIIPPRKGRPPLPADQQARVPYNVRLTPAQREKVERLGGAAWVRARIDAAREPQASNATTTAPRPTIASAGQ